MFSLRRWLGALIVVFSVASPFAACGQLFLTDPNLEESKLLAGALTGNEDANAKLLGSLDFDRAVILLNSIVRRGESVVDSTEADWENRHRALAGLVSLQLARAKWAEAARNAAEQGSSYRREGLPAHALEWNRRSLDYWRQAGNTAEIFRIWSEMAWDFAELGRLEEAGAAAHQARISVSPASAYTETGRKLWDVEIGIEISRKNIEGARAVLGELQQAATSKLAPPIFQVWATLAQADLLLAEDKFTAVMPLIQEVLRVPLSAAERTKAEVSAWYTLTKLTEAMVDRVPYAAVGKLTTEMFEIKQEWASTAALEAYRAMRWRRMLAGDLQSVIREVSEDAENLKSTKNQWGRIVALRELAFCWQAVNSTSNQIAALEEARDLNRQAAGLEILNPDVLVDLGHAYLSAGRSEEAIKTLQIVIDNSNTKASAVQKMMTAATRMSAILEQAEAFRLSGSAKEARILLNTNLAEQQSKERRHYDWEARIHQLLARLDTDDKAPEAALSNYRLALEAFTKSENFRFLTRSLPAVPSAAQETETSKISLQLEAAHFLIGQGRWGIARDYLDAAAKTMGENNETASGWQISFFSGRVWEGEAQQQKALQAYREAETRLESMRSGISTVEYRQSFSDNATIAELNEHLVALLTRMGRADLAWQSVERGKARSFVESLKGARFRDAEATLPKDVGSAMLSLELTVSQLELGAAQSQKSNPVGSPVRGGVPAAGQVASLKDRILLLRQESNLSKIIPGPAAPVSVPAIRELQAKLGRSSALVEFAILPNALTAFVITPTSFEQLNWTTNKGLESDVLQLRRVLGRAETVDLVEPLIAKISDAVWKPLGAKLPAGVDRLIIVPAGYLSYLPFQALTMRDGRSAIERYTISYLPSASTLLLIDKPKRSSDLFLGALGSVSVENYKPLPGTLEEVTGIARIYPRATVVTETALTPDAALNALRTYSQVHLATHGVYDPQSPLFSALLFSPQNGWRSRLSMYELMDRPIKARLVVLSACETGVGKLFRGDEVIGLTRTMLSAGAATVVSSLWQVSDEATSLLMREFYRSLKLQAVPADAMRTAALAVRKKYPDPMYWASFIVTGAE